MSATRNRFRWWLLGPMLVVAAWLALFGDKTPPVQQGSVARPIERTVSAQVVPAATSDSLNSGRREELAELRSRAVLLKSATEAAADSFGIRNWTPPPPPPPEIVVSAPVAPPLPFVYAGRKWEAGTWEVYLLRGDTALLVREGATLDGTYAVLAIKPPTMTLKYLPLGQEQTMAIGEAD